MAPPQAASKSGSPMGRAPPGAAAGHRGELLQENPACTPCRHPHSAGLVPKRNWGSIWGESLSCTKLKGLPDKDFGGSCHIFLLYSGTTQVQSSSGGVRRKCGREVSPHSAAHACTARGGGSPSQPYLVARAMAAGASQVWPSELSTVLLPQAQVTTSCTRALGPIGHGFSSPL